MKAWQMQEAKARLSEVVKCAESDGPQYITHHGNSVAVVVSQAMYSRLTGNEHGLEDLMRRSPLFGADDVQFVRDPSLARDVSL
jgi:prevent-host-death family protein